LSYEQNDMKTKLTPQALFEYANSFTYASEKADRGTLFPTFRQAAKHFRVRLTDIEDAIEDYNGEGYMGAAVGFRCGNGVGYYEKKGDYLVEAYPVEESTTETPIFAAQ